MSATSDQIKLNAKSNFIEINNPIVILLKEMKERLRYLDDNNADDDGN